MTSIVFIETGLLHECDVYHAREIGDHLFEEFADIPMGVFANEVMVNPKVVGEWLYPGTGAGRTTHFHMLKAAP